MKGPRFILVAALVLLGLAWSLNPAQATRELAKREDLACTVCHDKPGSKLLTDRGKYYEVMGTLNGYGQVIADFGACTTCHESKPGSKKLTRLGRDFSRITKNMEELRRWIRLQHPQLPEAAPVPAPPPLPPVRPRPSH